MFHFDCTMEDVRIVATEHRARSTNPHVLHQFGNGTLSEEDLLMPDGTFDVLHFDGDTGDSKSVNLTMEELAIVIHLGMVGDEGAAHLYDTAQVKRYQELMRDHQHMSFIP